MLLDLENFLRPRGTLAARVIDLFNTSLGGHDLLELFHRDEATVVTESFVSKVLATGIADLLALLEPLLLALPVTEDLLTLCIRAERLDRAVRVPAALVGAVGESRVVPISTLGEGCYLLGRTRPHLNVRRRCHRGVTWWWYNLHSSVSHT